MEKFHDFRKTARLAVLTLALGAAPAEAVVIEVNHDVLAGRSAFLASGVTSTQFDWGTQFAPNAHTVGVFGPQRPTENSVSVTLPDATVNSVVSVNPNALNFANWLDAPGFNDPANQGLADLAINGVESFDLIFGQDHRSLGFAVATGQGNLPNEFDQTGATFEITAFDAANAIIGSVTASLAAGSADQAWLTITSDIAFRRLAVREIGAASQADQYFSNMLTSIEAVPSAAPEPGTLALLLLGAVPLIGRLRRRD